LLGHASGAIYIVLEKPKGMFSGDGSRLRRILPNHTSAKEDFRKEVEFKSSGRCDDLQPFPFEAIGNE